MTGFLPALPIGGLAGWSFLTRTMDTQRAAHDASAVRQRDAAYFRDRIGDITTAEQLAGDRRLLSIALSAHGLQDDLANRFFIRKVLESNPADAESLAARLADTRYRALAEDFGFYRSGGPRTSEVGFADRILADWQTRDFEVAVGESDPSMRLALSLERELNGVLDRTKGDDARWFSILGTPPLRKVFETALGLPDSFGALDIDRQLSDMRERALSVFGTDNLADFAEPQLSEELRRQFLIRADPPEPVRAPILDLFGGSNGGGGGSILQALYGVS